MSIKSKIVLNGLKKDTPTIKVLEPFKPEVIECENKEDFSEIINSNINRYNEMSTQKLNQMFKVPGYKVTKIKGEIGLRTIKACEMNKSEDVSRIDKIEKEIQLIKDVFNQMSEQLDLIKHEVMNVLNGHEWS